MKLSMRLRQLKTQDISPDIKTNLKRMGRDFEKAGKFLKVFGNAMEIVGKVTKSDEAIQDICDNIVDTRNRFLDTLSRIIERDEQELTDAFTNIDETINTENLCDRMEARDFTDKEYDSVISKKNYEARRARFNVINKRKLAKEKRQQEQHAG